MAPIQHLVQPATFDACGVEQITLDDDNGVKIALLVHAGKVAQPDDVHGPASVVCTLADVPLETFLKTRQRSTAGTKPSTRGTSL
jgi:hypothetical protein